MKDTGTLFSDVKKTIENEEGRSPFHYRKALKKVINSYQTDIHRLITDEKNDTERQDKNVLRTVPKSGHLMIFEYQSKQRTIKYFDKYPIAYMISSDSKSFTAANLHYIEPSKREIIVKKMKDGQLLFPRNCLSKYYMSQVQGLFLDIAFDEWDTASLLPIENFVAYKKGREFPISTNQVWKDTNNHFKDMFKARRIYEGYGKDDKDFKGEL